MKVRSVVIANIVEFNRRAMKRGFTPGEYDRWDAASADLTDMALFWCGDDKLVILPRPPDESFVSDVKTALGYRNVRVVSPGTSSSSICEDLLDDSELFGLLLETLRDSNLPQIITWGATDEFYALLGELQRAGVSYSAPEVPPKERYWTALYLESKAGFREFVMKLQPMIPDLYLPEGFTCGSKELAVQAATHFGASQRGFVLKANYGTGGFSTLCYGARSLVRGIEALRRDALRRMSFDHFWDAPPVILEEHIAAPDNSKAIAPTIDFVIGADGAVRLMGAGKMLMRNEWLYSGVQSGYGSLDPAVEASMSSVGQKIGTAMANIGYRGWFDIDFVLGTKGRAFLTEINARRASPSHVFEIASQLYGEDWPSRCSIHANDHFQLQGSCKPSYAGIRSTFIDFNADHNAISVRAFPTIASSSLSRRNPYLGYVVLSEGRSDASQYASELEDRICSSLGMNFVTRS